MRLFPELLYTVTSSQGRAHQGMLVLLSEPQGAVGIFSPENYQGYYNGHTDEEPTPNLVIKKDTVKDYTFDLLPGQTMSVSSGGTK